MAFNPAPRIPGASARPRVLVAAVVGVSVWIAGSLHLFQPIDGAWYDACLRITVAVHPVPAHVLLVEVDPDSRAAPDTRWTALIDELEGLGARLIAFNFLPPPDAETLFEHAEFSENVVFGRSIRPHPDEPDRRILEEIPRPARLHAISSAVVSLPSSPDGVHRMQLTSVLVDGKEEPTLESLASVKAGFAPSKRLDRGYLVAFRGSSGSLPVVSFDRVVRRDVVPQLVEGRCVLIGLAPDPSSPGLVTPTTSLLAPMSLLEFQGHALNTLLGGRASVPLGAGMRLVVVVSLALMGFYVYERLAVPAATGAMLGITLAHIPAALVILVVAGVWVPVAESAVCQGALFLVALRGRAIRHSQAARQLVEESAAQLRDKYWPLHFYSSSPPWSLVVNMINQTLDLNKVIFLEVDPEKRVLREIHALGCSLEDIVEKRRDYSRSPYADAVCAEGPIKVRNFLKTTSNEEDQYLVPLLFSGELLGFWAIGIDASRVAAIPSFHGLLADYTASIGELVYHHRKASEPPSSRRAFARLVGSRSPETTYQELGTSLGLLRERLTTLENLLSQIEAGIIVYDIFGRILQINEHMLTLLNKEQLSPFEMTALDLILALSDCDMTRSRRLLRHVVAEQSDITLPVTLRSMPRKRYLMHLKALKGSEESEEGSVPGRSIRAKTILCEIVETTALTRLYELKSHLTDRLGFKLRGDLAAIDISSSLFTSELEDNQRESIAQVVHSKVQSTVQALTDCQQYLSLNADADDLERFPVDPRPPLQTAIDEVRYVLERRKVTLDLDLPSFTSYVLASSGKLESLFASILSLLGNDATEGSEVSVRVMEKEDAVVFEFSNTGFGLPNELLQDYVFGEQELSSSDLRNLRSAARWTQAWGGLLDAESDVGVGLAFTVHLVKFI